MKILIAHQHFRTPEEGGALRSYYLGQGLIRQGHEVSIITSKINASSRLEGIDGMSVRYLKVHYENRFGFFRRMIAYFSFLLKALSVLRFYKNYDLIYVMSTPLSVGVVGLFGKFLYRIPFVFEAGDLWPDVPIQMGIIRNRLFIWLTRGLERQIYWNASFVVALSIEMKELILAKGVNARVLVLENFCDKDAFGSNAIDMGLRPSYIPEGHFVIAYIGTLGVANKVEKLLMLAKFLEKENVSILIQGNGKELDLCKNLSHGLNNVHFIPFGNRDSVSKVLSYSDAVFVSFDKRYPLLGTGCPNKLMDGLAAGKLILLNYNGWQRQFVEKNDCGCYLETEDLADGAQTIKMLLANPNLVKQMQSNSERLASDYSIEKLVADLNHAMHENLVTAPAYSLIH